MSRDDIIRMAQKAGWEMDKRWDLDRGFMSRLERFYKTTFAAGASAERNTVAQWMIDKGYATGHGDTVEDLLKELEWQVRERERVIEQEQGPRQWQGLTDEERGQVINANFGTGLWQMAKDIETKLKEKNT